MKKFVAYLKVFFAALTNNINGKREDVHGRSYRAVYKKFGFRAMAHDYLHGNSWII